MPRSIVRAAVVLSVTAWLPAQGILDAGGRPDPAFPDLHAWYAAWQGVNGTTTPVDGAAVSRWHDLSVHGHDLVRVDPDPARHPTFRLHSAGGPAAVEFDGDDYLWADRTTEFGTLTAAKTVFFVSRVRSADGGYVFDGTTVSGRNAVFTGQSGAQHRWHTYAGATAAAGTFVEHDIFQVHSVLIGPGQLEHFVAGASIYSAPSTIAAWEGLTLGARYTLDHELIGDIAEVLVYRRALTVAERQAVEGYLLGRYIPVAAPVAPAATAVFVGGVGYPAYRIPSLLRTRSGVLLAFCEGRQSLNDHSQNDIVLRSSLDAGATWGALQLLFDDGTNSLNNPCAVQILAGPNAGRILLMFQRYPTGCHVSCVVPGLTGANICRCFVMHSDDDGATWSQPLDITAQVKRPTAVKAVASGPGIAIVKRRAPHQGRILFPFNQFDTAGHWQNYAVFSDDGGGSWSYGAVVDDSQTPGTGNEVQFVERIDGSILLNSRSQGGTNHRKTAVTTDGGATWGPMGEDGKLNEPRVMASVLRFTDPLDGHSSRIVFAGPDSRRGRVNGSVRISYDEGRTWIESKMIHRGAYAYGCLAAADERRLGVLYEAAGYARIEFATMTVEWLSDRRDCLGNGAHGGRYGVGCAGTGQWVPVLDALGCPTPGSTVSLQVGQGLGAALAVVAIGLGTGSTPISACHIDVQPILLSLPLFRLSGNGPAQGYHSLPIALPATMLPLAFTAQAFVLDAGAASGFSASNAQELIVF
ncbi:MAG: exo-alpha-sialidase [Planctomycetes bacterium]|nr:exo-alpha-sialidase [Planctomycetota bacterium]